MTKQEKLGLETFPKQRTFCECHILDRDVRAHRTLFTDHTYDNVRHSKNPENPHYNVPAEYFLLTSIPLISDWEPL